MKKPATYLFNLAAIGASNFKAFGEIAQRAPLKPITLIFGPNSAGKSSLIQSILWADEVLETHNPDIRHPRAAKGKMDLGSFKQIVRDHDETKSVEISLYFSGIQKTETASSDLVGQVSTAADIKLTISYAKNRKGNHSPNELMLTIDDETLIRAKNDGPDQWKTTHIDYFHPSIKQFTNDIFRREFKNTEAGQLLFDQAVKFQDMFGNVYKQVTDLPDHEEAIEHLEKFRQPKINGFDMTLPEIKRFISDKDVFQRIGLSSRGTPLKGTADSDAEKNKPAKSSKKELIQLRETLLTPAFSKLVHSLLEAARKALGNLTHIPPIRELPPRHFVPLDHDEWHKLAFDDSARNKVNDWLTSESMKSKYRIESQTFVSLETVKTSLQSVISADSISALFDALEEESEGSTPFADLYREIYKNYNWNDGGDLLDCLNNDVPELWDYIIGDQYDIELDEDFRRSGFYPDEPPSDEEFKNWVESEIYDWLSNGDYALDEIVRDAYIEKHPKMVEFLTHAARTSSISDNIINKIENSREVTRIEYLLKDTASGTSVTLQDVGVGISQMLPILVNAYAERNRLQLIEQPELHIHPGLQAELGDLFIESALGENHNCFLLETHSEHLILRLLRRIRETTEGEIADWPEALKKACPNGITPEDVAVLYIEPNSEGSIIRELPITPDGDFSCRWPGGFFSERSKELF